MLAVQECFRGNALAALHLNIDEIEHGPSAAGNQQTLLLWNHLAGFSGGRVNSNARFPDVKHLSAKETVRAGPRKKSARSIEDFRRGPIPINLAVLFYEDGSKRGFGRVLL